LSGLLEWKMGRPLVAEGELLHAMKVDGRACDAPFWLGHVRAESRNWPQSATAFSSAEACFDTDVAEWREALGKQQSNRVAINVRATTTVVTRLADAERRRAESSLNAAKSWLNGGQLEEAKAAITRALAHESTREEAQRLLGPKVPPAVRHLQRES
jgi:acyl-CoA reductase-like NAD-dependent aldehyde dehydrogenase